MPLKQTKHRRLHRLESPSIRQSHWVPRIAMLLIPQEGVYRTVKCATIWPGMLVLISILKC
jgi:hypothetical protein